jgi:hypothetical protein
MDYNYYSVGLAADAGVPSAIPWATRAMAPATPDLLAQQATMTAARTERVSPLGTVLKVVGFVSLPLLVWHGYKRNTSIGWAIVWGLGSFVWPITLPIAFAQGFAKPKMTPNRRRGRRRRRRSR